MSIAVIIGLITLACFVLVAALGRKVEIRRAERFAQRQDLTIQEFWENFYRESGLSFDIVADALRVIEQATGVSMGRLRPEDHFATELAPERGWEFDDGLAELRWELESKGRDPSLEVLTVDDFIRVYAGQVPSP